MSEKYLYISNDFAFFTLEGEGRYVGFPSVFLRLAMCNLTCNAFKTPDSPHGCDSYISWSIKNKMTFNEIFSLLETNNHIEYLRKQGHPITTTMVKNGNTEYAQYSYRKERHE